MIRESEDLPVGEENKSVVLSSRKDEVKQGAILEVNAVDLKDFFYFQAFVGFIHHR
ncbi:MAG: hypothetical protein KJ893_06945 [Candidatus Omnitrophica bacterium]|nr:hypothetical protein [Candidatus Omnitrophota bacterium]MBU4478530.1 hypothetical protein [Candidatus Omnitrophota bacterium]MCG2703570.1 hypothetical protein [Candidatus Omnitrophota bacterium]